MASLSELYQARVGANYLPRPEEMDEIRQVCLLYTSDAADE